MVLLLETVEHVFDPARVLQQIWTTLIPSGYLFLTAPNRFYPFEVHGMRIGTTTISPFFGIPLLSWAPNSVRRRVQVARIYTQKTLVRLCEEQGFRVLEILHAAAVRHHGGWLDHELHAGRDKQARWVGAHETDGCFLHAACEEGVIKV